VRSTVFLHTNYIHTVGLMILLSMHRGHFHKNKKTSVIYDEEEKNIVRPMTSRSDGFYCTYGSIPFIIVTHDI
jgi:hypothetical protein